MADKGTLNIEITAGFAGLVEGLKQATGAVKASTDQMSSQFGVLGKAIESLKAPFLALTGLLAGGSLFKSTIDATNEWNSEVLKMTKVLGVTSEEASVLGVALNHLGIETDTYTRAAQILARQISTGGKAFEQAGIDIKDSNGHLKSAGDLMQEVVAYLQGMREGTDRNAAGAALFGRAWSEVRDILKLTPEAMAEAEERAKRLHLIVGPEGIAQTKQYKAEMRDLDEVWKSFRVQLGNQLLPLLVQFGAWMVENGTTIAEGFTYVVRGLAEAFLVVKVAVESVYITLKGLFQVIGDGLDGAGAALMRLLKGDLPGALQAVKGAGTQIATDWNAANAALGTSWSGFMTASRNVWTPPPRATTNKREEGVYFTPPEKEDKSADRAAQADMELALKRDENLEKFAEHARKLTEDRLEFERVAAYTEEAFGSEHYGRELAALEKHYRAQINAAEGDLDRQLQLQREFEAKKKAIIQKAGDEIQAEMDAQAREQARPWIAISRAVSDAFATGFTRALFHAQSFGDAVKGVFDAIGKAFERLIEQMIAKLILSGILKLLGSIFGGPVGGALGQAGGDLLSNLFSFDVGTWGVPSNMVAAIHQGEIIVPPGLSAEVRAGRASIGAPQGGSTVINISAVDAQSFRNYLRGPGASGLIGALGDLARNGRI